MRGLRQQLMMGLAAQRDLVSDGDERQRADGEEGQRATRAASAPQGFPPGDVGAGGRMRPSPRRRTAGSPRTCRPRSGRRRPRRSSRGRAEARHVAHVPREAVERAAPQQAGDDGADPDVAKPHLGVRHEIEDQPDDEDEERRCSPIARQAAEGRSSPGERIEHAGEPARLDDVDRADEQQRRRAAAGRPRPA